MLSFNDYVKRMDETLSPSNVDPNKQQATQIATQIKAELGKTTSVNPQEAERRMAKVKQLHQQLQQTKLQTISADADKVLGQVSG